MKVTVKHSSPGQYMLEVGGEIRIIRPGEGSVFHLEESDEEWQLVEYIAENVREVHLSVEHEEMARTVLRLLFKLDVGQAKTIQSSLDDNSVYMLEADLSI